MTLGVPAIADAVFQVMLKERLFFFFPPQLSGFQGRSACGH